MNEEGPARRFHGLGETFANRVGVTTPDRGAQRGFGSTALKVHGAIFAMLCRDQLVVKLPPARVSELIGNGTGSPFDANRGTPMKQWLTVTDTEPSAWHDLAEEAYEFVSSGPRPRARSRQGPPADSWEPY